MQAFWSFDFAARALRHRASRVKNEEHQGSPIRVYWTDLAGYDKIIDYTEKPRSDFDAIRKAAPESRAEIKTALNGFLNNCKFENCKPNKGYLTALGLSVK